MSRFLVSRYQDLTAYTPGEQPRDRKYIKLNTNESPYPPSQGVINAVNASEAALLRLYPDPTCANLKKKLAQTYGLKSENVFVSNSSDDVLNTAFTAFASNERNAYFADITYGFYKVFCRLHGTQAVVFPLKSDFTIDCSDYAGLKSGLIVIANPNAPTGIALTPNDIKGICLDSPGCAVIVDEAYVDFGAQSCVSMIGELENLIVCRTYSKSMSMAGARLGFALAGREIISDLEKIKYSTNPYSVNRITLAAGEAALDDIEYYSGNCQKIARTREKTASSLKEMGFELTDSRANFVFARTGKMPGKLIFERLRENGILVRRFDDDRISDYLRITIGTPEEMDALIQALRKILSEG